MTLTTAATLLAIFGVSTELVIAAAVLVLLAIVVLAIVDSELLVELAGELLG